MHYLRTLTTPTASFALAGILGCSSGPGSEAGQRRAHKELDRGACPSFIIYPGTRSEFGRQRYGDAISDEQLAAYLDRELANCEKQQGAGTATVAFFDPRRRYAAMWCRPANIASFW